MKKNYLLVGASSEIASSLSGLLKEDGNYVLGLTTKENLENINYNEIHKVSDYKFINLPDLKIDSLDGLVYFPGSINLKPFQRVSEEDFLHDYTLNTLGAAVSVQKYFPLLKKSNFPSVVFISSVASGLGLPFHASISMAKGALESLTRSLASEFAPTTRFNCVAPSLTNTPLADKLINTKEKYEASEKRNPMNKVGQPLEIASVIKFLLSEQSSWITGQVVAVDGGMSRLKNK